MNHNRPVLIIAGLVLSAAVPLLLGAAGRDADATDDETNRRRIEAMSQSERARLQRNYETFLALSEAERDKYRRLHRELENDARNGGNLGQVLRRYNEWLKTLLPFQREELRGRHDPMARMELVEQYKDEQRREQWIRTLPEHQQRWLRKEDDPEKRRKLEEKFRSEQERRQGRRGSLSPGAVGPHIGRSSDRDEKLCRDDFAAVMKLVEQSVELPPERRDELPSTTTAQRHLLVLIEATRREQQPGGKPADRLHWPDEALLARIIEAVPDEVRRRIDALDSVDERRRYVANLVVRSFLSEWWKEVDPGEENLRQFFDELDGSEKDRIMSLTGHWQKRELVRRYFQKDPPRYSDEFREFFWRSDFARALRRESGESDHHRSDRNRDGRHGRRGYHRPDR